MKTFLKILPPSWRRKTPIIHVLRLEGTIMPGRSIRGGQLSLQSLEPALKKTFRKGVAAVALEINCPGGSPVQSALIADRIRELSAEFNVPVYAFCEDVAASGGYWLACAADEIYADQNSIVGSIGVISMGFGFPRALAKLGVERRVYTAGESKSTNDPFKPEKKEDIAKLKVLLGEMHESFKSWIRDRRGTKLVAKDKELFSGAYWTGARAKTLGLIDGVGHVRPVMKHKFGEKAYFRQISMSQGFGLGRFGLTANAVGVISRLGQIGDLPGAALETLEARAMWQRFGL